MNNGCDAIKHRNRESHNKGGGGMGKDLSGDCTVASGNQGTRVWLLPDKRGVAGDGVVEQVEPKM